MVKSNFSFFIFFLLSFNIFGANTEKLFDTYKDAIVIFELFENGEKVSIGTGFFISKNGDLLTNKHVFFPAVKEGMTVTARLHNGKVFKEILYGRCGEEKDLDICLLRLKHKPKKFFNLNKKKFSQGKKVFSIGHPRGYEFSISDGIISAYRNEMIKLNLEKEELVEHVQFTVPISPGNSGGPVFTVDGELIAMCTWHRRDIGSQNLNFGISSKILSEFVNGEKMKFQNFQTAKKSLYDSEIKKYKKRYKTEIVSIYNELGKGQTKLFNKKFTNKVKISALGKVYNLPISNDFDQSECKQVKSSFGVHVQCYNRNEQIVMNFRMVPEDKNSILNKKGTFPTPEPTEEYLDLEKKNLLGSIKKEKGEKYIKKALFSFGTKINCKERKNAATYFSDGVDKCQFVEINVKNYHAVKYTVLMQEKDMPYYLEVSIWMNDFAKKEYYYDLVTLGAMKISRT